MAEALFFGRSVLFFPKIVRRNTIFAGPGRFMVSRNPKGSGIWIESKSKSVRKQNKAKV
jgi:hypothetical protein